MSDTEAGSAGVGARATLDARAIALARPLPEPATAARDVLVFLRGGERFAIEIGLLLQVHRPRALAPVPGADSPVLGLIAWRGGALTVVDVGTASTANPAGAVSREATRVLVVGDSNGPYGIIADDVLEVRSGGDEDMLTPADGSFNRDSGLQGVTKDAVMLIDAEMLARRISVLNKTERDTK